MKMPFGDIRARSRAVDITVPQQRSLDWNDLLNAVEFNFLALSGFAIVDLNQTLTADQYEKGIHGSFDLWMVRDDLDPVSHTLYLNAELTKAVGHPLVETVGADPIIEAAIENVTLESISPSAFSVLNPSMTSTASALMVTNHLKAIYVTDLTNATNSDLDQTAIARFAADNTNQVPTISNFQEIGITGVNATNLSAINSAVDAQRGADDVAGNADDVVDVDTLQEVQAIVNAYTMILTAADGTDGNAPLTPSTQSYQRIGVRDIDLGAQTHLLNDVVDGLASTAVDSVTELQTLSDSARAVRVSAAGGSAPSMAQLQSLGVSGLTASNLAAVQTALALTADDGTEVDTKIELQNLVDEINGLSIQSVTIPNGIYGIGSTMSITVNPSNGQAGLHFGSAFFNGHALTNLTDNGNGTYSGTYTVALGDASVVDGGSVSVSLGLVDAGGFVGVLTTSTPLNGESIDALPPVAPTLVEDAANLDHVLNAAEGVNQIQIAGLEAGASWQHQVDGGAWVNGVGTSFTLTPGTHSYSVRQTDLAGNTSAASVAANYTLDSVAPTLVSSNPADNSTGISPSANLSFTFSENIVAGTGNIVIKDLWTNTSTTIAASDNTQVSILNNVLTLNPSSDLAGNGRYAVQFDATAIKDLAGNAYSGISDTTTLNFNTTYVTGQSVIRLGTYGNLIAPVKVEGNWYYYWDASGDGTSANSGPYNSAKDFVSMNWLAGALGHSISESDRSGTISGVSVVLPTDGVIGSSSNPTAGYYPGTANTGQGVAANATYDDLLSIWDAFNGTGTGTNISGIPTDWGVANVWGATTSDVGHVYLSMATGMLYKDVDTMTHYVALQVL